MSGGGKRNLESRARRWGFRRGARRRKQRNPNPATPTYQIVTEVPSCIGPPQVNPLAVLCFHRHSGFVPPKSYCGDPSRRCKFRRPQKRRSALPTLEEGPGRWGNHGASLAGVRTKPVPVCLSHPTWPSRPSLPALPGDKKSTSTITPGYHSPVLLSSEKRRSLPRANYGNADSEY